MSSHGTGSGTGLTRWVGLLVRMRRAVVLGWVSLLALAAVGALGLGAHLSGGGWYAPGSQSAAAVAATQDGFVGRGTTTVTLVVRDDRYPATDPRFEDRAQAAFDEVAGRPELAVASAFGWATTTEGPARDAFLGSSGRTTVTTLGLDLSDGDARRELHGIQADLDEHFAGQELLVALVGPAPLWAEVNVLSERGLLRAELLALPLLLVVMLWIYRGWVAALLSLAVAVTSVVWTLGLLSLVARHVELSVFVQNAATMLGLGVAVDYSLFVISRYREQVEQGETGARALRSTLGTAGHTVLVSGATVAVSMSTLFLVDLPVIRSLALGSVVVVTVAVAVNLVVLPALLAVAGHRVARRAGRHRPAVRESRGWERWVGTMMRRPVLTLLAGVGLLGALALPAAELSTFTPDARVVPRGTTVRDGWDAVRADFGEGAASPINVVLQAQRPLAAHAAAQDALGLPARLAALPAAAEVVSAGSVLRGAGVTDHLAALTEPGREALPPALNHALGHYVSDDGRTWVIEVRPDGTAASPQVRALVSDIRAEVATLGGADVQAFVGGESAEGIDGNHAIVRSLPPVALTMLTLSYLLLLITFRSVFLPLKAIAMNIASVAATYGVLVVVFQHGLGSGLLGFEPSGQVTNFVPVLLLALLFSLSTDYEVFLLSRVREEWLHTRDDRAAVTRGLALTAPLISGAAVVMVTVFGAFALAGVLPVQELGLGMAVAIAVDATIVRLVLVPASMRLLGRWNWWHPFPSLRRARPQHLALHHPVPNMSGE